MLDYRATEEVTSADFYFVRIAIIETHRDALLKILNESPILEGIATKDLKQIMGQIIGTNIITFDEDELTPEGIGHVKSLHIVIDCRGMIIFSVFIDNGSIFKCLRRYDSQLH